MFIYTSEMKQYLKEIIPNNKAADIAEMFNAKFGTDRTAVDIRRYKSNNQIYSGLVKHNDNRGKYNRLLTDEQEAYLKKIYKGVTNRECTRLLNEKFDLSLTCRQVKSVKSRLRLDSGIKGLYVEERVCDTRFKKGNMLGKDTQFKKGLTPHNKQPIGTEVVKDDGVFVKVSDVKGKYAHNINWKLKQVYVWEQHNGEVPKGKIVTFLDGDKTNFDINNLALVDRSELVTMQHHGLIYSDAELTKVGITVAKIKVKSNKRKKKKDE